MRLSDAELSLLKPKLIYPDHRPPPWPIEAAAPRSLEPIVRRRLVADQLCQGAAVPPFQTIAPNADP